MTPRSALRTAAAALLAALGTACSPGDLRDLPGRPPPDPPSATPTPASLPPFQVTSLVASQQAKLISPEGDANDWLGYSVGISGDTVVVGALLDVVQGFPQAGSASVWIRNGSQWL